MAQQHHSPIPDIPGQLIPEPNARHLKEHVAALVGTRDTKSVHSRSYRGGSRRLTWRVLAQISWKSARLVQLARHREIEEGGVCALFQKTAETLLTLDSYWVCEKSDGVRVLVFIFPTGNAQDVFLVSPYLSLPYATPSDRGSLSRSRLIGTTSIAKFPASSSPIITRRLVRSAHASSTANSWLIPTPEHERYVPRVPRICMPKPKRAIDREFCDSSSSIVWLSTARMSCPRVFSSAPGYGS
jgi:hypothetical protein